MAQQKCRIIWLDNARIIATYAVIVLHVSAGIVVTKRVGTENWWTGNFFDSLVRWCVPVFIMISGALLLDPTKQENFLTFYKKRLSRLLIPSIFWSLFYVIWPFLKGVLSWSNLSFISLVKQLVSGIPYYHMWFIYMIWGLYLFTPFFRKIVTYSTKQELVYFIWISFIIALINCIFIYFSFDKFKLFTPFIDWFFLYIPYFFVGYFIRKDNKKYSKIILWCIFLISVILTLGGCYVLAINQNLNRGLYFYDYLSITVIPMSISLMYVLKSFDYAIFNVTLASQLSKFTLGIYFIHPVILEIISHIGCDVNMFHPILSIPLTACITFIISAGMVLLIYKIPYIRRVV